MRSTWHELEWRVRIAAIISLSGGAVGLLDVTTTAASKLSLFAIPLEISSVPVIPLWLLWLAMAFSVPLGGVVTVYGVAYLLVRPAARERRRILAFSVLSLSMVVLFLGLPLLYPNG